MGFFWYILHTSPLLNAFCQYFLPVCGLSFHSLKIVFAREAALNFNESPTYQIFSFMDCAFGVMCVKTHHQTQGHLDFILCDHLEIFFQKSVEISCLLMASLLFVLSLVSLNRVLKNTGDGHFFVCHCILK